MNNLFETLSDVGADEISTCECHKEGWRQTNGEWEKCSLHYRGQLHPESRILLLDEPARLREEVRLCKLRWKVEQSKDKIDKLVAQLLAERNNLLKLELELTNRTPTIKVEMVHFPKDQD